MYLNEYNFNEEPQISINSFYDVFPQKRTMEEMREYKQLVGMPMAENYEELVNSLI